MSIKSQMARTRRSEGKRRQQNKISRLDAIVAALESDSNRLQGGIRVYARKERGEWWANTVNMTEHRPSNATLIPDKEG